MSNFFQYNLIISLFMMSNIDSIAKMNEMQKALLLFIDEQDHNDDHFQELVNLVKNNYVEPDEFKQFLYLLARISNNYIRSPEFINKIEQILNNFKDSISKYGFKEIFNIFKGNRRVILYFIKEKIISLEDPSFLYILSNPKYINLSYHRYLFKEYAQKNQDFNECQNIGENPAPIAQAIRIDSVDQLDQLTKNNVSKYFEIKGTSMYESNSFLSKNKQNNILINYAAFFGSVQVFKHMLEKSAKLTPITWLYAIHGRSIEILNILKEKSIKPPNDDYNQCFIEAIKCHHKDVADYIKTTFLENVDCKKFAPQMLKYYNFWYFQNEWLQDSLSPLIKYGYTSIAKEMLSNNNVDLNILFCLF